MNIHINPNNPRFIKDDKFKKLVQSIKDFPKMLELRPIIVNLDGMILGGNMRYRALQQLGWEIKPEWVKTAESLTAEEQRRFIVEDNVGFGDWDWDELSTEYEKEELEDWGMDVDKWKDDEVVEDEVPEVTDNPVSKLGEIYQLGRHRIMCGDSTKIEDVEKLMDGKKADMVFTDPPYGISYKKKSTGETIKNDNVDLKLLISNALSGFFDIPMYVCCDWRTYSQVVDGMKRNPSNLIVWKKPIQQRLHKWEYCHEFILYFGINGSPMIDGNVWEFNREIRADHPTIKPIELCAKAIKSEDVNIVADMFSGSGSTLIACEQTNRICYGMEIDPKYIDVIRKRYWKFVNGSEDGWEKATPQV